MKRLLMALVVLCSMLAVPAAFAGSKGECPYEIPPPEGAIELGPRERTYSYTVTLEAGVATATVGNDDCSNQPGTVLVDEVAIPAPTTSGGRSTAELGFVEAGTYTFSVEIVGRISVWLLIESVPSFDGVVACGESTMTVGDGVEAPGASFVRGDDDDSEGKNSEPCTELVGYNLDSETSTEDQTVSYEFETSEYPSWFGEITWTAEPAATPLQPTQIDEDGDGTPEGDLQWCSGFSGTDGSTGNPLPVLPAGESWCLISQSATLIGGGMIQVVETIYGATDPSFVRPR